MTAGLDEDLSIGGLAAIINSRLAYDARIANAIAFAWLCSGVAIALVLTALGAAAAYLGYSYTISIKPAADEIANALADAIKNTEIHTKVTGTMALSPDAKITIAPGQMVSLQDGTTVQLDSNSKVRVAGNLTVPQPSQHQLQPLATSKTDELPFTTYMIFRTVPLGTGVVETGWQYDLSDTIRPRFQHCYYRQNVDEGLVGKITIAFNGAPERPSPSAKLPFRFEEALADCSWFSGY